MGKVAENLAKRVYVTSDNPRSEDPDAIITDILGGMEHPENAFVEPNRRAAIATALHDRTGDEVVVVLGKGDEQYQIIYDQHLPFDDREVIRTLLSDI